MPALTRAFTPYPRGPHRPLTENFPLDRPARGTLLSRGRSARRTNSNRPSGPGQRHPPEQLNVRKQPTKSSVSAGNTPWSPATDLHRSGVVSSRSRARQPHASPHDPGPRGAQAPDNPHDARPVEAPLRQLPSPSWRSEWQDAGSVDPKLTHHEALAQQRRCEKPTGPVYPPRATDGVDPEPACRAPGTTGPIAIEARLHIPAENPTACGLLCSPSPAAPRPPLLNALPQAQGALVRLSLTQQASGTRGGHRQRSSAVTAHGSTRSGTVRHERHHAAWARSTESTPWGTWTQVRVHATPGTAPAEPRPQARRDKRTSQLTPATPQHIRYNYCLPAVQPPTIDGMCCKEPGTPAPRAAGLHERDPKCDVQLQSPAAITAGPSRLHCSLAAHPSSASAYTATGGPVGAPPQVCTAASQPLARTQSSHIRPGRRILAAPRAASTNPALACTAGGAAESVVGCSETAEIMRS